MLRFVVSLTLYEIESERERQEKNKFLLFSCFIFNVLDLHSIQTNRFFFIDGLYVSLTALDFVN